MTSSFAAGLEGKTETWEESSERLSLRNLHIPLYTTHPRNLPKDPSIAGVARIIGHTVPQTKPEYRNVKVVDLIGFTKDRTGIYVSEETHQRTDDGRLYAFKERIEEIPFTRIETFEQLE